MKKIKLLSIFIIMLSVVALGVFMGKQIFKMMEADSLSQGQTTTIRSEIATGSSVKVLYTTASSSSSIPQPKIRSIANIQDVKPLVNTIEDNATNIRSSTSEKFVKGGAKWFAYASAKGANVRNGPSIKNKKLFKVAKGTRGVVLEQKKGWTEVKWGFNKRNGWVRDDLLVSGPANVMNTLVTNSSDIGKISADKIQAGNAKALLKASKVAVAIAKPAPVETTVKGYTKGGKLPELGRISATPVANIRVQPGIGNAKVGKLPTGVTVKIKSVKQVGKWQWFEIIFSKGRKTGWTREDNLTF